MSNIRYVLWDADTRKQVANFIVGHALPVGSVVNLPALSKPENTMVQVFITGIWQIVSPPEVAMVPSLGTVTQKVWVREVGQSYNLEGADGAMRYEWLSRWEEQAPPFLEPPEEIVLPLDPVRVPLG